jgi:DNA-binding MarR family transcriptional regulator
MKNSVCTINVYTHICMVIFKTLEQEIKQKFFSHSKQKVMLNILFTANWLRGLQVQLFKKWNISPEQYNVLRILRGQKGNPIGISGIQSRMLDKSSNASRLVDKLIEKQLVERKWCSNDRRQVEVFISQQGLHLLEQIEPKMQEQEQLLGCLTPKEEESLNILLNKLRTNN